MAYFYGVEMKERWMIHSHTEGDYVDFYHIYGNTFPIKDDLRALGGQWNAQHKRWEVMAIHDNLESLRLLQITLREKCKREAFCHEDSAEIYLNSADIARGFTTDNFCGNCDSRYSQPVKVTRIE